MIKTQFKTLLYSIIQTWRDLRRKARTEGSVANRARNITGNATPVPAISEISQKILGVMGTEGAFGIHGAEESGIGFSIEVLEDLVAGPSGVQNQNNNESTQNIHQVVVDPNLPQEHQVEHDEVLTIEESNRAEVNQLHQVELDEISMINMGASATDNDRRRSAGAGSGASISRRSAGAGRQQQQQRERQRRNRPQPQARANQFLEAELDSNNILRDIANQLNIMNRNNAVRSRQKYKEK
ncbi:unnamed protein product [Chilo suppressalis]|uniref:Uncharacterized protein n=1 Tax=Chilo suppressalis TaxID=168631 RepID=A0ABN8BC47_CHISP|nr:unnamed protein product [Chilo suppressalis]